MTRAIVITAATGPDLELLSRRLPAIRHLLPGVAVELRDPHGRPLPGPADLLQLVQAWRAELEA